MPSLACQALQAHDAHTYIHAGKYFWGRVSHVHCSVYPSLDGLWASRVFSCVHLPSPYRTVGIHTLPQSCYMGSRDPYWGLLAWVADSRTHRAICQGFILSDRVSHCVGNPPFCPGWLANELPGFLLPQSWRLHARASWPAFLPQVLRLPRWIVSSAPVVFISLRFLHFFCLLYNSLFSFLFNCFFCASLKYYFLCPQAPFLVNCSYTSVMPHALFTTQSILVSPMSP